MILNKVYIFLSILLLSGYTFAQENYLNIDAAHFEANEKKMSMVFKGDVKMTQNKDILSCQVLQINTKISDKDSKKQVPKDFNATGDVLLEVHTNESILKAQGDVILYYPDEQKYIIIGNGYLEDLKDGKKLTAHKIYIDAKTGHTKIDGDTNKPINFRIKLSDMNNNK